MKWLLQKACLTLGVLTLCMPGVQAKHIKVFILTGQSNSLGTTANKTDTDPENLPASELDARIPFFWSNRSTTAADGPAAIIGDSGGKILTMRKQQGQGRNPSFWGPEVAFCRGLYENGGRDFLLIKASRGGGGNGYWLKGKQMYQHVLDTVQAAVAQLEKHGHTYEIVAMLYLQGESNSATEAKLAGERLGDLIDELKKDLPHARSMLTVVGGIAASGERRDLTRRLQKELADRRDDTTHFSTMDLQSHLYDRLHFDKKAKLEIGKRFYMHFVALQEKKGRRQGEAKR
ncbi:sialate O-acetylesterase [Oceaniferula marina]|nr:sialate O-acetylesterase [Oceaniferula marina]